MDAPLWVSPYLLQITPTCMAQLAQGSVLRLSPMRTGVDSVFSDFVVPVMGGGGFTSGLLASVRMLPNGSGVRTVLAGLVRLRHCLA